MAKSRMSKRRRLTVWAAGVLAVTLAFTAIVLTVILRPYYQQAQQFDVEAIADQPMVAYEALPQHLVDALVAAEDSRFFQHHGLDSKGVMRAALANWRANTKVQGGSTITQQLAKQTFGLGSRTIKRKLVEGFVARRIEQRFDKQTILRAYLSIVYFGNGFGGIHSAAQGYYQKDVSELSVSEAATLIGLIKAPSAYEPYDHPARAKKARDLVLQRMAAEDLLSPEEASRYQQEPLQPVRNKRI